MSIKHVIIFLLAITSLLVAPLNSQARGPQSEQQLEVSMRMIGHRVLLNAGDSTSRVLPIEHEEGRYRIKFDTDFQFDPGELVTTVNEVVRETEMGRSYIMEVEECETGKVVYSYQMGDLNNPNIIACQTRLQPKRCYSLCFTLLESENRIAFSSLFNLESVEGGTSKANRITYPLIALVIVLMIGNFIVFRKKKSQSKIDPNLIALGDYQFDKRNTELLIDQERIELTSKEADLLMLLYDAVNTTIEREVILNRVWGDEGGYVGRTLDVFISKLRKKLEADPKVKIVNTRGVGYKLVLDV